MLHISCNHHHPYLHTTLPSNYSFAIIMFLSNILNTGPLIAAAVTLLLAAICYGIYKEV